jgi:hypothetical protein
MSVQISYLFTDATFTGEDKSLQHRDEGIDAYMDFLGFERLGSGSDGAWRDIQYGASPGAESLFMNTPSFQNDLRRIAGDLVDITYDDEIEDPEQES